MKTLTLAAALLLMGCQGQNPFKRQGNPLKNYPNVTETANRPYVPGQKAVKPAQEGAGGATVKPPAPPCFEPLKVEVSPDHGSNQLKFVEETSSSFDLKMTVKGYAIEKLKVDRPDESQLVPVSREGDIYTWRLTWKPSKDSSRTAVEPVVIGFEDELPAGACAKAEKTVSLKVTISKSQNAPVVSFSGVKEKIKFGDKFDFKVIVDDQQAEKGKVPSIKWAFKIAKESADLDASAAVTKCTESRELEGKKFEFVCSFDSNLIKKVDGLLNSGQAKAASFLMTATSAKTGSSSLPAVKQIRVLFEKIVTTTGAKK